MSRTLNTGNEDLRKLNGREELADVRRAHLDQGVRVAEACSTSASANVSLRGGHRESAMLDPFGLTPGRLFGERGARSYAAGPGFGDGNPPGFSAGNNWKSLKLNPLLPNG